MVRGMRWRRDGAFAVVSVVKALLIGPVALSAGCIAAEQAPEAKPAEAVDYGLRPKGWRLSDDAKALLAEWAKTPYRRISDHTAIFVRAQLKYGINRSDFLHHWYDRPLLQDSSLGQREDTETETRAWLNAAGWKKTVEMGRLGKQDGFAVFTCTKGREEVIPLSVRPGSEATILVELTNGLKLDDCVMRAEQALKMPNSFRLGGKVVLTSYPSNPESRLPFWAKLKETLDAKFGDKFLLMPYVGVFGEKAPTLDAATLRETKDRLVRFLRVLDGICYNSRESYFNLRYDPWLFDNVLAPLLHAAVSDPEFAGKKYLATWATPGHENSYRWNKGLDSTGTRMLRDTFDSIVKLQPDFVVGCEWDEENENTHFRPTVANGFTHQRLLRYYADTLAGRAPDVFPGDRTDIPNLVLSHRKDLMAGEQLETEVLNIPDGTFKGETLTVRLVWKDAAGRTLRAFEPRTLKADELKSAWFTVPVTALVAQSPVAVPEVTVWAAGRRWIFSEGLWNAGLHASRTLEQKWVKEPLRDLPQGTAGELSVTGPDAEGLYTVRGKVASARKLRSIAVLDGADTVFMEGGSDHRAGQRTVRIAFQGHGVNGKVGLIRGRLAVEGAAGAKLSVGRTRGHIDVEGNAYVFKGAMANNWPHTLFVDLPEAEAATAKLVFDLKPFGQGEVSVADLQRKQVVAFPAGKGMSLVFTDWRSARAIPDPQMKNEASFSFALRPDTPRSVFRLETVDEDYHVWRGKAVSVAKPVGREVTFRVYEDQLDRVSAVTLDAGRVPEANYVFEPSRGGVVAAEAGRGMWGVFGTYAPLVTGYGQGESGYGMVAGLAIRKAGTPEAEHSSPAYADDGAIRFERGNFVSFGQQIVPTQAGFVLTLDVKPTDVRRRQGLVTCGPTAFNLFVEKGEVRASLFLRNRFMRLSGHQANVVAVGTGLKPGEWNRIRVACNQTKLAVEVNGVRGEAVDCRGNLFYPQPTALGAGLKSEEFFEGEMRGFSVRLK